MVSDSYGRTLGQRRPEIPHPRDEAAVRLFLLDGFQLLHDGVPVVLPYGLQRLVALAALRPAMSRAHLAGLLWPETPEERALSCLRTALWRLRRLGANPVLAGEAVRLDPRIQVDVDELTRVADRVRPDVDPSEIDWILSVGRHDLLPGWYEDWVLAERERLRQLRLHAIEEIARAQLRRGRYGEALQAALEAARTEPLRETPHRLIIEIHLAEGNAYEALHAFYAYRELTLRDLQLEPSNAMRALLRQALADGLGTDRLPDPQPPVGRRSVHPEPPVGRRPTYPEPPVGRRPTYPEPPADRRSEYQHRSTY